MLLIFVRNIISGKQQWEDGLRGILMGGVAALAPASGLHAQVAPAAEAAAPAGQEEEREARRERSERERATDDEKGRQIVITGARTRLPATALPITYDVLGGEKLKQDAATYGSTIDALSATFPSFSPSREKLSGSGETLRGRSPLFAINGVPQSTPIRDGARDGYTIDPFFIDRVEVIYGSNALQGIGATGGVVNQVTVGAPAVDGLSFRGLTQGTAQEGWSGNDAGGKSAGLAAWRSGAWDVTGGAAVERRGAFTDAHGDRIGVDGTQGEIQDSDSWSLFGRLGYQVSSTARLELVANRFDLEGNGHYVLVSGSRAAGIPATSRRGETPGKPTANRAELLSLSFTEGDLAGGALTAQAFFSRTRDIFGGGTFETFQDASIAPIGTLFDQSVNRSRKLGGKLTYERTVPGFDDLTVTGGLDLLTDRTAQNLLLTGRTWVPETTFRSLAPFVQGNLKLVGGPARLVGGVRYENVRLDVPDFTTLAFYGSREVGGGKPKFEKALVNGGVIVEPLDGLRAYASYAEGYTIADVGRILRAINVDGVDVDNFLDLRPVISNNRELGIEWRRGALRASASYWWSKSKFGSLLVRNPDGIFDVVRRPIDLQGFDAELNWDTPLPGVTLSGAYAYVKGRTDTNGDGRMDTDLDGANISPNRLNLHAGYSTGPFLTRLTMRKYSDRKFDTGAGNDFKGYTLFDAVAGYRIGKQRVLLTVQNLTNKYYITYNSQTVGTNDTYFAGRGRTVTLGLASDF
jgi:iron complex outermembrane receptor protein